MTRCRSTRRRQRAQLRHVDPQSDGTFQYTHDGSENFSDSFVYELLDADGGVTDTATVSITITPVNDNDPVAGDDSITVAEGGTPPRWIGGFASVLNNDADTDLPNDACRSTRRRSADPASAR